MEEYNFSSISSATELDKIINEATWAKSGAELEISKLEREQRENAESRNEKQSTLDRAISKETELNQKLSRLSPTDPERPKVEAYLAEASGRVVRLRFDASKSLGELMIQETRTLNMLRHEVAENTAIINGATARKAQLS